MKKLRKFNVLSKLRPCQGQIDDLTGSGLLQGNGTAVHRRPRRGHIVYSNQPRSSLQLLKPRSGIMWLGQVV